MFNMLDQVVRCDGDNCKKQVDVVGKNRVAIKNEIGPKDWEYAGLSLWLCPRCAKKQKKKA